MAPITAAGEDAIHVAIELSQSSGLMAARLPHAISLICSELQEVRHPHC
jgi:hypothetical protein